MDPAPAPASIVIPTYREAQNLPTLVKRIVEASQSARIPIEIIIVDDHSGDGTEGVCADLARDHPVRLITRTHERGLSGAVLHGLKEAQFDRIVVMDADLQHPPEAIPAMLTGLEQAEFVIATRYGPGGEIAEDWPWHRHLASRWARLLARPLTSMTDPLSGFFAIRRPLFERARHVRPIGYKIALELFVKSGCKSAAEVPITFAARHEGQSKLNLAEQLRYTQHLVRLYAFRFPVVTILALVMIVLLGLLLVSSLATSGTKPTPG